MLKTVSSITNAIGALNYNGTWNASTNTPTLASGVGTKGDYYVVSVAGSTSIDGQTLWGVGDWIAFNGTVWQKVDGGNTGNFTTVSVSGVTTVGSGGSGGVFGNDDASYIALGASQTGGAAALYMNGSTRGGGLASTATLGSSGFQIYNNIFTALNFEVLAAGGIAPGADNSFSCGTAGKRWSVVYAGNGTINTSDANQKQDVEELNDAEKRVATRLKSLIKKFRFKDAVQQKCDAARIHVGVIAQDVQAAFEAEGLNADRYGVFCSDTWWEAPVKKIIREATLATPKSPALDEISVMVIEPVPEGTPNAVQKTQLGVRYDQLFAFVISSL